MRLPVEAHIENFILTDGGHREPVCRMTFPASAIAVTRSDNIRENVDMGTVRLNYRFGGAMAAKY